MSATTQGTLPAVGQHRASSGRLATPIPCRLGASHAALPRTHHEEEQPPTAAKEDLVDTQQCDKETRTEFFTVMLAKPSTPMNW